MPKKLHPGDLAVLAGITAAKSFSVHLFRDGQIERTEGIPTLAEARAKALEIGVGASRRPGVYAITADGAAHLVPSNFDVLANIPESEPDMSDIPEAGPEFFEKAKFRMPEDEEPSPISSLKPRKSAKRPKPTKQAKKSTKAKKPAKAGASKTEIAIKLLSRPQGATRKEVTEATDWPSIQLKPIAKRHGLKLVKQKDGVLRFVSP